MTWWGWMILGAVLFCAELFAVDAQFYLVFLGISAALVGVAGVLGVTAPEWAQWLAFATLSLISMVTFRQSFYKKIRGGVEGFKEGVAGERMVIANDLEPNAESRIEFRGSMWTARNVGPEKIQAGSEVIVVRTDGLTLHVRTE